MKKIKIAIDGPAGAGKSSVARAVAEKLGYLFIDTGAMYRALTLVAIEEGIPPDDESRLVERLKSLNIRLFPGRVFIGERNITADIRTPAVDALVSQVCAHSAVRVEMVARQREMAQYGGIVMEGRDIGTVVLPDAELKIFMNASPKIRARRRGRQLENAGISFDIVELEREIVERDRKDSTREDSPLTVAKDAIVIDNSEESFDESVEHIERLVKEIL